MERQFFKKESVMRHTVLVFICLIFPVPALAEKILVTGDTQYGWFGMRGDRKERENFRKIVNIINDEKFDAVIVLGDLADSYPKTFWRRSRQIRALLDDIGGIKNARVFFVPGNHDLSDRPTAETEKKFREDFGTPVRYTFRIGGYKFLVINTTLIQNYKWMPKEYDEQLKFIGQNRDARFILGHHPPFYKNPKEGNSYFRWKTKPRNDILPLFAPGTYFFSGHTHRPFQTITDGLNNMNPGTCCAPWRNGHKSYGVLEISGKTIRYTEKKLE